MASVASQLIEEVTAHAQSESLEDAREICADGIYFPNNLRISRLILLRIRNVPRKICRVNQNTHFIFNNFVSKIMPFTAKI